MSNVVAIPTSARPLAAPRPTRPPLQPSCLAEGWRPEQLWLSDRCWDGPALDALAAVVDAAARAALSATDAVLPELEVLIVLRLVGPAAAALRQTARVLRGPRASATPLGRDLAVSALWLASVRHDDMLAAIECSAELAGRAISLENGISEEPLPPGIPSLSRLVGRMRRRGREVLSHRLTWPDLDTIGSSLTLALAEDPLAVAAPRTSEAAPVSPVAGCGGGFVRVVVAHRGRGRETVR